LKILTVVGARPQFIKASSVSREIIYKNNDGINIKEVIVHTGQHYDENMSDIFFNQMQIPIPKYNLNIGGGTHGAMTGKMIKDIEDVLIIEKPDLLLIYGDTNSTLAGAIAASKLNIMIAHVEAGLRSFNNNMPEEINRILTDRISNFLFCPTEVSVDNLINEGVSKWNAQIHLVGDVMQDSAIYYSKFSVKPDNLTINSKFILATCHRAENTDDEEIFLNIISSLEEIAKEIDIVFPIHPRARANIAKLNIKLSSNIHIIDPVGYLEMIWLINKCEMVITDSGGLQKEAYFFSKHCITMRKETEWIELVENGYNILSGITKEEILKAYKSNNFSNNFDKKLYGNGNASKLIVENLISYNLES